MPNLVTIYGGSGFVGRYIVRRMARAGWRVRVAVRRPNEAMHVRVCGAVGQVEPVACNIRDDASVRAAMAGADAAVNCVGTFKRSGPSGFDAIHVGGAGRIARIAAEEGVGALVHLSAIGADADSASGYSRTKALGERAIEERFGDARILRPSVVFGPEDAFFNRFAAMARFGPVLPIVGADAKFQPVYVDNVAEAVQACLEGRAESHVYELGGPDIRAFRELIQGMLEEIRRRRLVLNIPFALARPMAGAMELAELLTLGLAPAQITRDQVESLKSDSVVGAEAKGLRDLGIEPVAVDAVLPEYIWRFRPSGQYEAIAESADGMSDRLTQE